MRECASLIASKNGCMQLQKHTAHEVGKTKLFGSRARTRMKKVSECVSSFANYIMCHMEKRKWIHHTHGTYILVSI